MEKSQNPKQCSPKMLLDLVTQYECVMYQLQVQQEMSLVKSQPLKSSEPLKSTLETVGAQVKLEAATIAVVSPGASLPGCSVRSLLNDMGLQVSLLNILVYLQVEGTLPLPRLHKACVLLLSVKWQQNSMSSAAHTVSCVTELFAEPVWRTQVAPCCNYLLYATAQLASADTVQHLCPQSALSALEFSALLCAAMQEYIHKFEAEHVKLHMLLGIDHRGLEALGMHSYGHREQLIEGVKEYLRAYLRAAETTTQISAKY